MEDKQLCLVLHLIMIMWGACFKQEGDNNVTGYEYYNLSSRLKNNQNDKPGEEYVYDAYGNL